MLQNISKLLTSTIRRGLMSARATSFPVPSLSQLVLNITAEKVTAKQETETNRETSREKMRIRKVICFSLIFLECSLFLNARRVSEESAKYECVCVWGGGGVEGGGVRLEGGRAKESKEFYFFALRSSSN